MNSWQLAAREAASSSASVASSRAVEDVFADGAVEEKGFLAHDADVRRAAIPERDAADVLAVNRDAPGGRFVEGGQQVDQGGFAGARSGRPARSFRRARACSEMLRSTGWLGVVAEADVLDRPPRRARAVRRAARRRPLARSAGGVQDVEHAFAGGAGRLQHLVQPVQPGDRLVEQRRGRSMKPTSWPTVIVPASTCRPPTQSTSTDAQRAGKAHRRRVGRPDAHDAERALAQVVGALGEAARPRAVRGRRP